MSEPTNAELSARLYKWVNFVGDACAQDLVLAAERLAQPVEVEVTDWKGEGVTVTLQVDDTPALTQALTFDRPVLLISKDTHRD